MEEGKVKRKEKKTFDGELRAHLNRDIICFFSWSAGYQPVKEMKEEKERVLLLTNQSFSCYGLADALARLYFCLIVASSLSFPYGLENWP